MKLIFTAILVVLLGEHYVIANARFDYLEDALNKLNISTKTKLLDRFPRLKAKAVKVTSACYQPVLNSNGTVMANIFEDDMFTVVKQYFKVNYQRLVGLSAKGCLQRIQHLLQHIAKLAESIFECQTKANSKLGEKQQQQCLTSLGDTSPEERSRILLRKPPPPLGNSFPAQSNSSKCSTKLLPGEAPPPPLWDWRNEAIVTKARNQNPCGTCFIFSAVGAAESAWRRYKGGNSCEQFSEQAILNCIRDGKKNPLDDPCTTGNGGWPMEVFERMRIFGATPLEKAPYVAQTLPCEDYSTVGKVAGQCYHFSETNGGTEAGEEVLKLMLYRNGPLAITIDTNEVFNNLCPGQVFEGPCTTEEKFFHAVLLVGYDQQYWYIKNSYGGSGVWGDSGFFRMPRGRNLCRVGNGYAVPLFEL